MRKHDPSLGCIDFIFATEVTKLAFYFVHDWRMFKIKIETYKMYILAPLRPRSLRQKIPTCFGMSKCFAFSLSHGRAAATRIPENIEQIMSCSD